MKNKVSKASPEGTRGVFVGLSGGVDSAVSAALLKKEGYSVTGVFIKAWTPEGYPCTWKEDRRSAMRAAAVLDIPFLTLDLEREYKEEVVDYMIAEYRKGRTPNPDVMCNKEIKFGHFLKFALDNGADFVATGHYAQIKNGLLAEGADKNKDQSYFLWTLNQEQLKHVLFPIGHLQKPEVRKLADKFKLPQATRKDSQGLCFLGKVDMKEFLSRYIQPKRGEVLSEKGEVVGHHNGALFFTLGERHGFNVKNKTDKNTPLYVTSKDIEKNTITVAGKHCVRSEKLSTQEISLSQTNFNSELPSKNLSCRVRYRGEKIPCETVSSSQHSNILKNLRISVRLKQPQMGISPGQSLVIYNDEICLGGGIMEECNT